MALENYGGLGAPPGPPCPSPLVPQLLGGHRCNEGQDGLPSDPDSAPPKACPAQSSFLFPLASPGQVGVTGGMCVSGGTGKTPPASESSPTPGRLLRGQHGAPSLGSGSPQAARLECGSEVGDGGACPLPVQPEVSRSAWRLHCSLLVLPLDHLVVLPVLQVGSQLRVLSLLGALPGSVTLLVRLHE